MSVIKLPKRNKNYKDKLGILEEIVPSIKKYEGELIVIHINGSALYDEELLKNFANDVALMKRFGANVVIVHGGEKYVEKYFNKFNLKFSVDDGIIITNKNSIDILEMVLKGYVASKIVSAINDAGGSAIGLSGKDGNLIDAKKFRKGRAIPDSNIKNIVDFGFNGEPTVINPEILLAFEEHKIIPVISPVARGENAETFHINAITASSIIASSVVASHYLILDNNIVLKDKKGQLIESIDFDSFENNKMQYTDVNKVILDTVSCVMENHVNTVHLVNGSIPHALLLHLFTEEKVGTRIEFLEEDII
jgi:acetylglutamate kinase